VRLGVALQELHRAENDLVELLLTVSSRHQDDPEVHHAARDLATWSQDHVRKLAEAARRYGEDLDPQPQGDPSARQRLRERLVDLVSDRLGRHSDPPLRLLHDLRAVHVAAAGVSVDWELIAQAAQGLEDEELMALAAGCHADTLRQVRWADAQLKEAATQALTTG
jgi:hypothetical protein